MGFNGSEILDPAMGTGNFFGNLPVEMAENSRLYGVELDSLTARIAKELYPEAKIQNRGFERTKFENGTFDVIVGNVPFGDFKPYDPEYDEYFIHDYFFAKSIDKLKPGGIMALITSAGTMDKYDDSFRRELSEKADFLGGVRLPEDAFRTAGTQTVTDILFFQKLEFEHENDRNLDWVRSERVYGEASVFHENRYFRQNPEMVLGTPEIVSGRYGNTRTIKSDGNTAERLSEAISRLDGHFSAEPTIDDELPKEEYGDIPDGVTPYTYYVTDTDVYTSFYAVNIGDTPFIGKSSFSIYDSGGDTPKMYEQLKEENKELIKVTGSQSGVSYTYAYTSDELETVHADKDDHIKIFVDNPANVPDEDGIMPYVSPYKLLGSYKHGDEINLGSSFKGTVAYKIRSTSGSTLKSGTVEITCPAGGEETMGWIKWHTPNREQSVVITLEPRRDTLLLLDEDGNQCDKLTINADIAKVKESTPPDPLVSDTKPSWQKVYSQSSVQERISGYVSGDSVQELSWYTWSIGAGWSQDSDYDRRRVKIITGGMTDPSSQTPYWGAETENQDVTLYTWGVDNRYYPSATASKTIGSFHTGAVYISTSDIQLEKVTYSVSMSAEAAISPSDYCKTAAYSESSGKYTMKSGYGIQISVDTHLSGDTQYCTGSQTANVLFTEFNYNRHSTTLYNRLLEKSGGSFVFRKNKYSTYNDRVHFTPIWFPDRKNYTVYVEVFDVWCPAGQLSVRLTDQIFINGNVYDDWHIAPTKP